MQNPFSTQPELFVTSADLEHPSLQGLDGAEAVLDWPKLERIMAGIYANTRVWLSVETGLTLRSADRQLNGTFTERGRAR